MYNQVYIMGMSKRFSIAEARANLPAIIDLAESGQGIEVTRRGKPVAVVLSLREYERLNGNRARFTDVYAQFLKQNSLRTIGVEKNYFDAARRKEKGRKVTL